MAVTLEQAQRVGYTFLKALLRFAFMVANNLVAIPSYVLYLIVLQPLRVLDSESFWYIEGVLFKWLLAMVASWGWWAGYTELKPGLSASNGAVLLLFERMWVRCISRRAVISEISDVAVVKFTSYFSFSLVMEWGDDVKAVSEDEAVVLVNHQATGDVCTLMMCLQDKGTVVRQMMWLMDHIFKYTNFGIVSLIHGDFFIRQHVTLPRFGATQVIMKTLVAPQENGTPAGGDAVIKESKSKGLQWVIDATIAYPKGEPIDIQTWILGYRQPTVTHVHYRIFPIKDVPAEPEALSQWLYQRFIEKEHLLTHFYETGRKASS
ncbi:hypothetical protein ASZ78_000088 [Callipepla squamata]|uniref:Acyltransferase C-terminal domain-containing protein n=1 Tax=Callipepla squamata TaxID=9009 RepID=A0A226MTW8_CALSU|nr:hypothetical protein ASZ78_000088 [Callipepla squamata]